MRPIVYSEGRAAFTIWEDGIAFGVYLGGISNTDDHTLNIRNWVAAPC